ncbi:MAG: cupin domain-containing protein [Solirubrobacteraceae bacterium]
MSGYTTCAVESVPDVFGGQYPGAMRFMGQPLGAEQLAFTHRLMPPKSGGKGSYGHRHRMQEEIYYVVSGRLEFKLGDEVIEVGPGTAVRVAADTWRSVWNEGPEDAEMLIVSVRSEDPRSETEMLPDFWPD